MNSKTAVELIFSDILVFTDESTSRCVGRAGQAMQIELEHLEGNVRDLRFSIRLLPDSPLAKHLNNRALMMFHLLLQLLCPMDEFGVWLHREIPEKLLLSSHHLYVEHLSSGYTVRASFDRREQSLVLHLTRS